MRGGGRGFYETARAVFMWPPGARRERGGSVPSPIPRRAPTRGGDSLSIRCSGRASPQLVSGAKLLEDPVSRPLTRPSGQSPCTARPHAGGGGVSRGKNGVAVKRMRQGKGALAVVGRKRCLRGGGSRASSHERTGLLSPAIAIKTCYEKMQRAAPLQSMDSNHQASKLLIHPNTSRELFRRPAAPFRWIGSSVWRFQ